jgi:CBS-domain-containing membrane protein
MPPVARAGDDVLHIAKLALASVALQAVYVVDDDGHYLGVIGRTKLTREVFEHIEPGLYLAEHPRARGGKLLHLTEDLSKFSAGALIETRQPLQGRQTLAEALAALYRTNSDELPVINQEGRLLGVIRSLDILQEWVEDLMLVQGDETGSFY